VYIISLLCQLLIILLRYYRYSLGISNVTLTVPQLHSIMRLTQYGRIGRSGSEKVILQLIRFKCMPCLLYALEACPVNITQLRSLEFTLNRVLMKVFRTTSMDVIAECRYWFGLLEMETLIAKRKQRSMAKYSMTAAKYRQWVSLSIIFN